MSVPTSRLCLGVDPGGKTSPTGMALVSVERSEEGTSHYSLRWHAECPWPWTHSVIPPDMAGHGWATIACEVSEPQGPRRGAVVSAWRAGVVFGMLRGWNGGTIGLKRSEVLRGLGVKSERGLNSALETFLGPCVRSLSQHERDAIGVAIVALNRSA